MTCWLGLAWRGVPGMKGEYAWNCTLSCDSFSPGICNQREPRLVNSSCGTRLLHVPSCFRASPRFSSDQTGLLLVRSRSLALSLSRSSSRSRSLCCALSRAVPCSLLSDRNEKYARIVLIIQRQRVDSRCDNECEQTFTDQVKSSLRPLTIFSFFVSIAAVSVPSTQ